MAKDIVKTKSAFILTLIIAVTFLIYYQVIHFDFISYDDQANIQENVFIQQGISLVSLQWAFGGFYDGNWIPINWFSHSLVSQFFGMNPGAHHMANVILHLMNISLLYAFLRKLSFSKEVCLSVVALFALHPIHVESVAWISERKDVLSAFFFFWMLLNYLEYIKTKKREPYLNSLLCLALGLMSKPMLVTAPAILLILDGWPLHRFKKETPRKILIEKVPFFILSMAATAVTFFAHRTQGWVHSFSDIPIGLRLANASLSYVQYLRKLILPFDLAIFYPYESIVPLVIKGCLALIFLGIVTLFILRITSKAPYVIAGWLWYLLMLSPVIGLVSFAGASMGDRFVYLPMIGIYFLIVQFLWGLAHHSNQRVIIFRSSAVLILILFAVMSHKQISYWRNSQTLFEHAAGVTKNNFVAYISLGDHHIKHRKWDQAAEYYEKAMNIRPDPSTLNNLGNVYVEKYQPEKALAAYKLSLSLQPNQAGTWQNLGLIFKREKDWVRAGEYFANAIQVDNQYWPAYVDFAEALIEQGRAQEVIYLLERAISRNPTHEGLKYWKAQAEKKLATSTP